MPRATKIVATLGPASNSPEVLERMIRAGVDVVRLNFSHGKGQDHIGRPPAGQVPPLLRGPSDARAGVGQIHDQRQQTPLAACALLEVVRFDRRGIHVERHRQRLPRGRQAAEAPRQSPSDLTWNRFRRKELLIRRRRLV